ncbi:P-loop containing nucleoside triphosphate hydrolase protein [Fimicolochytrium jonesii]|uniref:P-loop containing nucleoside triphosphate hydrolase protein n=1 Tax=Fimicolochytrium jonesii TaxID=1396493 RepID=UPI0022FDD4FC|nr:P-loop containing nucleoside triphosphate hydrolase protein [Fimicolochytrium jonesii]KAI8817388.1 P-loop containing nucleoside triphosphate hydrolase protein [Fimicolochytrium jonesii]
MPLESLEQCTPTPRITARNASAVSASGKRATPSKRKPKLAPTPLPERALERSKARSVFERAREKLHMSVYPDALPCREDEYAQIYSELTSAIEEGSGGCVYISGVPGTGKTATVHAVMRALDKAVEDEELSPYRFVEINGMKLTEPAQAYSVLWEALTGKKVSSTHALSLLQKHFTTPSPNRQPTVLLMDEIDLLVTKNHSIMYNFLTWPDLQHARLIVVAIANTMDLPERMMINKVSSRLGLTRINFPAYTHQQLIEIVQSRLEGVQCFEKDAVELCARKIGAVSGDARRALDICRRGVEILEAKLESAAEAGTQDNKLVTMMVIDQAVKEMFASVAVQSVGRGSTHQRVFLVALVRSVRRAGIGEVEYGPVSDEHYRLCDMGNLPAPTAYDLYGICAQLHTSRLILLEQHRAGDRSQKLQLNISEEDVVTAVQNGGEAWLKRQVQSQ